MHMTTDPFLNKARPNNINTLIYPLHQSMQETINCFERKATIQSVWDDEETNSLHNTERKNVAQWLSFVPWNSKVK